MTVINQNTGILHDFYNLYPTLIANVYGLKLQSFDHISNTMIRMDEDCMQLVTNGPHEGCQYRLVVSFTGDRIVVCSLYRDADEDPSNLIYRLIVDSNNYRRICILREVLPYINPNSYLFNPDYRQYIT